MISSLVGFAASPKITPINGRVLLKQDKAEEKIGSLLLSETAKKQVNRGEVISISSGERVNGKIIPHVLKPGDRVIWTDYGGYIIKIDEEEYVIAKEENVQVILK
jgi:chaperonin GroES